MALAVELKRFLEQKGVDYQILVHPSGKTVRETLDALGVDPGLLARATLLRDSEGLLLAVHRAQARLDLDNLNRELGRDLRPLQVEQRRKLGPGQVPGGCVPLAEALGLPAAVDEALAEVADVYIALAPQVLCRLSGPDFCRLQGPAFYGNDFVRPPSPDATEAEAGGTPLRARLDGIEQLPPMPQLAGEILQLSVNPYANASDLAAVIEQDPSLATQVIRYANSPLYGYRGEIQSIQHAIARVLGYDMVIDIALGAALAKGFRNPMEGPLGLQAFWRHATYCAVLAQRLATGLSGPIQPHPGMAYLCGLVHNLGLLLLGHLFPEDFRVLVEAVDERPDVSVAELEQSLLGVTHMELGGRLMEAWALPPEVGITVKEHHNPAYRGQHAGYALLVLVANRLLWRWQVGDEARETLPEGALEFLGLEPERAEAALAWLGELREGVDRLASAMAA